jgi:hypothetical protein
VLLGGKGGDTLAHRRDIVVAVLLTFCFTVLLLMMLPIRSNPSAGEYDAWADINEDGAIDIYDAILLANAFGTSGNATKLLSITNWELNCYHRYTVEFVIDVGNASLGNANPVACYVHVTYQGHPIVNLVSNNFHVCTIASPLGFHPTGISIAFEEALACDGCYKFECVPFAGQQWAAGTYVFYIGVWNPAPPASTVYNGNSMTSFTL